MKNVEKAMWRFKLRGEPTWLMNFSYGWFRYNRVIIRWRYLLIWPEYIARKKEENVPLRKTSQTKRT